MALDWLTKNAPSANQTWEDVVGKKPEVIDLTDKTLDKRILDVVQAAGTVPAIAASKDEIPEKANPHGIVAKHGLVVLRLNTAKRIELWDPMMQKQYALSLPEFRVAISAVHSWD